MAHDVLCILKSVIVIVFLVIMFITPPILISHVNRWGSLEDVQDVIIFVRHGERRPLVPIPELGEYNLGELTPEGVRQVNLLGNLLQQAYAPFLTTVKTARATAANEQRCLRTAELVMATLGVKHDAVNVVPYMSINRSDPSYSEFVEHEKAFAASVPPCTAQIASTIIDALNMSLPEEFKLLYGVLIADSLDSVREQRLPLPFGLDSLECLADVDGPFVSQQIFNALTELGTATFLKPTLRTFLHEAQLAFDTDKPSFSLMSFSDVHIAAMLYILDPTQIIERPQFGAHLALHFRGNYLDVYYSPSYQQSSTLWVANLITSEVLTQIEKLTSVAAPTNEIATANDS